jgi:quercetin dioxygenase-like cupin family protein
VSGPAGIDFHTFVSEAVGATDFSTGLGIFKPGALLPCHTHPISEAITVVEGQAHLIVQDRAYRLNPHDCAHIPAAVPHLVRNDDPSRDLVTHSAFASARPAREPIAEMLPVEDRGLGDPSRSDPETITRFAKATVYELSENAFFTDLFARRFGAVGICGGYGRFLPGSSLPCHTHEYDESISIVRGTATCMVQGRRYELSGCATAYIPKGLPHRFINTSNQEMAMIWVYAGDEPDRQVVDNRFCSGLLPWTSAPLPDAKILPDKRPGQL